ncbi:arylsulfatase [Microbacterium sp. A196]|uniref:arylsulfatase n=1 Tax=unclassified Microbacterium TaxID=2609290 RepID=UPI003F364957
MSESMLPRPYQFAKDVQPAWPDPSRPPAGAPNVIVILADDLGFSDIAPFGSEIETPALDELAASGYRMPNYQTPPLCAPARAALLTGLNPHRAGFATVPHSDPGYDHSRFVLPPGVPTLAESFGGAGYATFMLGKWHLTPEAQQHDLGERASWPLQKGFDRFLGILDGFTNQHSPHRLIRDNGLAGTEEYAEDYFLTDELTDQAVRWIRETNSTGERRPFFMYFAHPGMHAPLQAPVRTVDKYRGRYAEGWDRLREQRFTRQKELGVIPEGASLPPSNAEPGGDVADWTELDDASRARFERYMEVYAAGVDAIDQSTRRIMDVLREHGELENTIIVFTSDNGASGEGGAHGTRSYYSQFGVAADVEDWPVDVEAPLAEIGTSRTMSHYPRGWAQVSNTPFRLYKSHLLMGGVRAPLIISWPAGLPRAEGDGGIREQFAFATDIGPTLLDLAGCDRVTRTEGREPVAIDGESLSDVIADPAAARLREQYQELIGRRSLTRHPWKLVSSVRGGPAWKEADWALYDLGADPTEIHDLASEFPDLVAEMADRFVQLAWQNGVFPIFDDGSQRRRRPESEAHLSAPVRLHPDLPQLERFRSARLVQSRTVTIRCVFVHSDGDEGVLVSHGDQGGGYAIRVESGGVRLIYNEYGALRSFWQESPSAFAGRRSVSVRFEHRPGRRWGVWMAQGAGELQEVGTVRQLLGMAPFAGISVGRDAGGPVDFERPRGIGVDRYSGMVLHVDYEPGPLQSEAGYSLAPRFSAAFD